MKRLLVLLILASCAPKADKVYEYANGGGTTTDAPSKWKGGADAFPLTLKISSNFEEIEKDAIHESADAWETGNDHFDFFNIQNSTPNKNSSNMDNYNDAILGIYKSDEWNEELPSTALAVTQVLGNKKSSHIEIYHADIVINYKYFSFSTDFSNGYDLQTVVLHELGHFLGLYHSETSTDESVMYPSIGRFTVNREPKSKDNSSISKKYKLSDFSPSLAHKSSLSFNHVGEIENNGTEEEEPSEKVVIIHELHTDGSCRHFENGKLTSSHKKF